VIFFYSDNGYLIGDHGLIDKRNAYEGSVRVPMVVAGPGTVPQGSVNNTRIRNLDLAPTFLAIAGLEPPPQFEGQDAWPVIKGDVTRDAWNEPDFVYQYYWEWSFPMTPTTFAIVRDDLKYIQYHGIWDIEELYDLKNDPMEKTNLINDPNYYAQRQALRIALYEQTASTNGKNAVPYTPRLSEGMNLRNQYGPTVAPFPNQWKVEPNRADKFLGLMPDTPAKKAALESGKPYNPWLSAPAVEPAEVEADEHE
jgi:arylsulfatase A-like enzyme